MSPLPGGVSSDIWRVDLPDGPVCVKRALARLKVDAVWEVPVERSRYEWAWMQETARVDPTWVPPLVAQDPPSSCLVMGFLDPADHPLWKARLRRGEAHEPTARTVGARLAAIHRATAGRADLRERFDTGGIFHAIRLEPYLLATAERHPDLRPRLAGLAAATAETRLALVHGDVSPKNILLGRDGPVLLDAECAWYGDPAFDLEAVWVDSAEKDQAQTLGYTVVDASTVVATHLNQILQKHTHELLGHEDVQKLLDMLAEKSPKLAEELVPGTLTLKTLLKVLQNLLREQVPIRDLRTIAEALAAHGDKSQDPATLTGIVRVALARQIVQNIVGAEQNLPVITLEPGLEQLLLKSVQQAQKAGAEESAFIEPTLAERLQKSLIDAAQKQELTGKPVILLVAGPLRMMMAKFVRFNLPDMAVLAYTEIPDNKQVTIEATVGSDS